MGIPAGSPRAHTALSMPVAGGGAVQNRVLPERTVTCHGELLCFSLHRTQSIPPALPLASRKLRSKFTVSASLVRCFVLLPLRASVCLFQSPCCLGLLSLGCTLASNYGDKRHINQSSKHTPRTVLPALPGMDTFLSLNCSISSQRFPTLDLFLR